MLRSAGRVAVGGTAALAGVLLLVLAAMGDGVGFAAAQPTGSSRLSERPAPAMPQRARLLRLDAADRQADAEGVEPRRMGRLAMDDRLAVSLPWETRRGGLGPDILRNGVAGALALAGLGGLLRLARRRQGVILRSA